MVWKQNSPYHWDCGEMRIVKENCPRRGGIVFKLWDGIELTWHESFESATKHAEIAVHV